MDSTRCEYSPLISVISDTGSNVNGPVAVSALAFDNVEELLWMGNAGSHVTSYYGYQLQRYTSFQVHSINDIRSLLTGDFGLLSLTSNTLRLSIRRGLTLFNHASELLRDMQTMSLLPSGLILMGGQQKMLIEFDLERVKQLRITDIEEEGCVIIRKHPKFVCCGDVVGKVCFISISFFSLITFFVYHNIMQSAHALFLPFIAYFSRFLCEIQILLKLLIHFQHIL